MPTRWFFCHATLLFGLMFLSNGNAQIKNVRTFNIRADHAEKTLKLFSEQSGRGLIVSTDIVKGVQTNAVHGEFAEMEALQQMLSGTGLEAVQDEKNSAFVVRKISMPSDVNNRDSPAKGMEKNQREIKTGDVERNPLQKRGGDEGTIQLNPYEVTETKGTGVVNQGIIPREENQALRYEILDRSAIERSGAPSLPELFRQVSSVANFGTGTQATYGSQMASLEGINTTSDEINLRGLGSNNTLVMINGRRIYNSEDAGADISRIPLASVERIEILPGSGSAIYGAGATAGVINIILRKNYSGTELSSSFGTSTNGGAEEARLTLYHGTTFNEGKTNLTVSLDYRKQWELLANERGYYEEALRKVDPSDTSNYIRTIVQNFYEQRGTVTAGGALNIPSDPTARFAAVPVGSDGVGLTLASFNETAGVANITSDRVGRAPLVPELSSYNFNATLEHEIRGEDLGVYLNTTFGYVDRGTRTYVGVLGALTMLPTTPNNPFGRAVQVYMEPTDLPWTTSTATQRSYNVVAGIKGQSMFLNREFKWSIDASWSRNESSASNVDYTRLVRAAIRAGLYNPLRDLTNVPQMTADQAQDYYSQFSRNSVPEVAATNWRANGGLFDAWGGEARFSVGAELRLENQFIESLWDYGAYKSLVGSGARPSSTVKTFRRAQAVYGEMTLPIVGPQNRRPMVYALDLSAAIRYEQYDDFGSAAPPMIAARYAPSEDIMLRGSWSSGFQPPLQNQLFAPQTIAGPWAYVLFNDTLRPGLPIEPYYNLSGGNPNLSPETSDSYDLGMVFTPRAVPGLTLSASYFRYDKRDLVRTVSRQDAIDSPDLFPGRVTRGPASAADIAAGRPGPITEFDLSYTNISRQIVDGWDFSGTYVVPETSVGTFTFRGDATYTMSFREQLRPGLDFVNSVGDLGFSGSVPVAWRGKLGVQWNTRRWTVNLTGRYIDSYVGRTNNPTPEDPSRLGLDGDRIPSSFEMDLQLGYTFPYKADSAGSDRWLNGCQVTLGILNIADRAPPLRTERMNQWYSLFNDPRQRYVTLSIKKPL